MSYGYDANGNVTSASDLVDSNNNQAFYYDALNRLTTATSPAYSTINLTYDHIGNILTNSRVGTYAYGTSKPHAATTAGTNTYAYDATGNMTTKNTSTTMIYDYENRLTNVKVNNVDVASFVYNYSGARVKKISAYSTTTYIGKLYEKTHGVVTKHIFAFLLQ